MFKDVKNSIEKKKNSKSLTFLDKLLYRIVEHDVPAYAGSLTYFFVLSIFPFLIALINAINFSGILSADLVLNYIKFLPLEIKDIVMSFLNELSQNSSGGLLSISVFLGLFSASSGINKLITNINRAYGFKDNRNFLIVRALALLFTVALILMVILLSLTQVFGKLIFEALIRNFELNREDFAAGFTFIKFGVPVIYMFLTYIFLYRLSPKPTQKKMLSFKSIIPGSVFATVMTILATAGFSYYVNNFGHYSVTYGSLGGIVVFLIWLFLMSFIVLLGGEINATLFSMKYFPDNAKWPRYESFLKNFIKS